MNIYHTSQRYGTRLTSQRLKKTYVFLDNQTTDFLKGAVFIEKSDLNTFSLKGYPYKNVSKSRHALTELIQQVFGTEEATSVFCNEYY